MSWNHSDENLIIHCAFFLQSLNQKYVYNVAEDTNISSYFQAISAISRYRFVINRFTITITGEAYWW